MGHDESFPRSLTPLEHDLLLWLLPSDRPGYQPYRILITTWRVAAKGRRGEGNYILAAPGAEADNESPLPQIFAYGNVVAAEGTIAVTVRERIGDQLEYEIVNLHEESVPQALHDTKRWTFSSWSPQLPCPICAGPLREVVMKTRNERALVLALCSVDRRIWVYDEASRVNHPIPRTNFYNELMLHARVRDPKVALDSNRLFADLQKYSDADLSRAFSSYNNLRVKVLLEDAIEQPAKKGRSLFGKIGSRILKR